MNLNKLGAFPDIVAFRQGVRVMPNSTVPLFCCPNCQAKYRVVKVPADPALADREITCRACGAPLQGREGGLVLKYFMVDRPDVQALRQRQGQLSPA
jgi:hypothetical protein